MTEPFNYSQIEPGVFAGSIPHKPIDIMLLRNEGIGAILTLTRRDIESYPGMGNVLPDNNIWYCHVPVPDHHRPEHAALKKALDFLDMARKENLTVYVHCRGGIGRTGKTLAAWYRLRGNKSSEQIAELLSKRWHRITPVNAWQDLKDHQDWLNELPNTLK